MGCLKISPEKKYIATDELREIPFPLSKLCTRDEWEEKGSVVVRKRFKEAFIKDSLLVKRTTLFDEIKSVLRLCDAEFASQDIAVVSHSFRLKLFEAFLGTNGKIVRKPELIDRFIKDDEKNLCVWRRLYNLSRY